jgi:hypothetical protein
MEPDMRQRLLQAPVRELFADLGGGFKNGRSARSLRRGAGNKLVRQNI